MHKWSDETGRVIVIIVYAEEKCNMSRKADSKLHKSMDGENIEEGCNMSRKVDLKISENKCQIKP